MTNQMANQTNLNESERTMRVKRYNVNDPSDTRMKIKMDAYGDVIVQNIMPCYEWHNDSITWSLKTNLNPGPRQLAQIKSSLCNVRTESEAEIILRQLTGYDAEFY